MLYLGIALAIFGGLLMAAAYIKPKFIWKKEWAMNYAKKAGEQALSVIFMMTGIASLAAGVFVSITYFFPDLW